MIEQIFGDDGGFVMIVPIPPMQFSEKLNVYVTNNNELTVKKFKKEMPPDKSVVLNLNSIINKVNEYNFLILKLASNIINLKCEDTLKQIFKPSFMNLEIINDKDHSTN